MKRTGAVKIISGRWRGLTLENLNPQTHPMGERERNAVFNSLAGRVAGARVLDLFAGTGALGLEALSRGAREVVLVDRDAESVKKNLATLTKTVGAAKQGEKIPEARVVRVGVHEFLADLGKNSAKFPDSTGNLPAKFPDSAGCLSTKFADSAGDLPLKFDLIFADPPYGEFARYEEDLRRLPELLAGDGILVISQPAERLAVALADLETLSAKTYAGAKIVIFGKK